MFLYSGIYLYYVKGNICESNTLENKIYLRETQHNTRPTINTGFNKGIPFNEDNSLTNVKML